MREEREAWFWRQVVAHPDVAKVMMGLPLDIAALVSHERVIPLAGEHGGFLFCALDGIGRVYELHTLFTPEGWGREVHREAKLAFAEMFRRGAQIITTYEIKGWASPPLSFGWKFAGDFTPSPIGDVRSWVLTEADWDLSPARRRGLQ